MSRSNKKKKTEKVTPVVGDRVRLKGRNITGEITYINPNSLWSNVAWDWHCYDKVMETMVTPPWGYVHLHELEKIDG